MITRREFCSESVALGIFAITPNVCIAADEAHVSRHLTVSGRVNLGSFYTPARYVSYVADWLKEVGVGDNWTVADLSSGYGAFFELSEIEGLERCYYVANDIDEVAVAKGRELFPNVRWMQKNALKNVDRETFALPSDRPLVIVGNPPYNDVTSQINQRIKTSGVEMDEDIRTRDLGMSSLLAYNKLKTDYVAVLHPLSYLIKKANFSAAKDFFANYRLINHIVFSSQEFEGTSKSVGFPVIVALYKRSEGTGLTYEEVCGLIFHTVEGDSFSLNGFDYVANYVDKYPHKKRFRPEILFYTMRDINALSRSRTFLTKRVPNAVDVDPEKVALYCYIDCFKHYAKTPYWMGNFNVPFVKDRFEVVKDAVLADARYRHQDVFGESQAPTEGQIQEIKNYILTSIKSNQ